MRRHFFVDEEGETSSQLTLIMSSCDFLAVIPESSSITYGGESISSDYWELSSDEFDNDEAADFIIVETGSGILLMVPQTRES